MIFFKKISELLSTNRPKLENPTEPKHKPELEPIEEQTTRSGVAKASQTRHGKPGIEIWQWQINCVQTQSNNRGSIPQNFGLIIGTQQEVENRLKESIQLSEQYETRVKQNKYPLGIIYEFISLSWRIFSPSIHPPYPIQIGAIRMVSKNLILIPSSNRDLFFRNKPKYLVEDPPTNYHTFKFTPIKPNQEFIEKIKKYV